MPRPTANLHRMRPRLGGTLLFASVLTASNAAAAGEHAGWPTTIGYSKSSGRFAPVQRPTPYVLHLPSLAWTTAAAISSSPKTISPDGAQLGGVDLRAAGLAVAGPTGSHGKTADAPATMERAVVIAAVKIRGREQVSEPQVQAILRAAGLEPGVVVTWPEDERVNEVRARLIATGYFRRVTVGLRPLPGSVQQATLTIDLDERSSLSVEDVYLASSQFTPFHGGVSLLERNFLGRGVHFGGAVVWGLRPPDIPRARNQQSGRVHMTAPALAGLGIGLSGTVYYVSASEPFRVAGRAEDPQPELFRTLDYSRLGGVLGVTIPFSPELRLGVDYRFEQVDAVLPPQLQWSMPDGELEPIDFALREGTTTLTTAEFSLRWDGRDRQMALGSGARFGLDVQLASPLIGSEHEFAKIRGAAAYSFRLPWGHWLTPGLLGGQVSGQPPRFELFYPGDLHAWTPGRELGLIYSTRTTFDVFGTGVDTYQLVHMFAKGDVEYATSVFRRSRTAFVEAGHFYINVGTFLVAGDAATRRRRAELGLPEMPVGFDANIGLRLETSLGVMDISVGNALRRLPL